MSDIFNLNGHARTIAALAILALAGYGFGSLAAKLTTYLGG